MQVVSGELRDGLLNETNFVSIPCGHCIGCRLDKSRQWADRMMLELDHTGKGIFVTLTYDPDHAHPCGTFSDGSPSYTLDKRDVQLFMKRLREHFSPLQCRFYLAGEYGDSTLRPHYHAVIFGLDLSDFPDLEVIGTNEFNQIYYNSNMLSFLWRLGFTSLSSVSWQTCAYVARYVTKKITGVASQDRYDSVGQLPEFSLMSRRPGIGGYYLSDHPDVDLNCDLPISDPYGVRHVNSVLTPKYLYKSLELTNPELYATVSEDRLRFSQDKLLLEMQNTDLSLSEYLSAKERSFKDRAKLLKRKKVR